MSKKKTSKKSKKKKIEIESDKEDIPKPIQKIINKINDSGKYLKIQQIRYCLNCGEQKTLSSFPTDEGFVSCNNCKKEYRIEVRD